jgi:hypothetical protein
VKDLLEEMCEVRRAWIALFGVALVALLAAACGTSEEVTSMPTLAATPTPAPEPTAEPAAAPTPEPTPTPTAVEILRRSDEAMSQLVSVTVDEKWGLASDDKPPSGYKYELVEPVVLDGVRPFGGAAVATNVKIEREEEYENQPVWVVSYEFETPSIDSQITVWRTEWIAKDSFLLLRQEEVLRDHGQLANFTRVFRNFNYEKPWPTGPYFEGDISGTRVITYETWKAEGSPPQEDCAIPIRGANNYPVSVDEAVGTPLEISPTYLPAGAVENPLDPTDYLTPPAMVCGGQISRVIRTYVTQYGPFSIERWRGPNFYVGKLQAEYTSPGEINGKPAIFVRRAPYPPESGLGGLWATAGLVIIPEEFGFTVVKVDDIKLPFEEAVKIAEGLE